MGGATLNQGGTLGWNSGPWDQRPLEAPGGRARLHVGPAGAAADRHRPRRGRPLRLVVGPRHRLHREARRRPPVGSGRDPRRRHPAPALPAVDVGPGAARTRSRRGDPRSDRRHGERVPGRPPRPARRLVEQLPPVRREHEYRRHDRRRGSRRGGAGPEPRLPRRQPPVAAAAAGRCEPRASLQASARPRGSASGGPG